MDPTTLCLPYSGQTHSKIIFPFKQAIEEFLEDHFSVRKGSLLFMSFSRVFDLVSFPRKFICLKGCPLFKGPPQYPPICCASPV